MLGRRVAGMAAAVVVAWLVTTSSDVSAQDVITFWHSGTNVQTQAWLRENIFPEFEKKHNVVIEDLAIGWGTQREEKLAVAFAAGVGPDIIVGSGNTQFNGRFRSRITSVNGRTATRSQSRCGSISGT